MKQINFKNVITNIFGLVLWSYAVYRLTHTKELDWIEISLFIILIMFGIMLFKFEYKTIESIAKGFLSKIKGKV
jgi:hypothetical protein